MTEPVAREAAEAEYERWLEAMDLVDKTDPTTLDEEDKKSLIEARTTIVRAIERGSLVINDDGLAVYTPQAGDDRDRTPLTFHEPDGAALMAMDQKRSGHDVAKTFASLAAITKQGAQRFARMKQRDLRVVQALFVLFLG